MFGDQTDDIELIADAGRTVQCRRRREPEFADVFTAVVVDRRRRRKRVFFDPDHHVAAAVLRAGLENGAGLERSEEHTSELQSLMRTSYAVFCLKKKKKT